MEYQPVPERGETEEPPFYNCSECFEPIEIIQIENNNIKFKCYNKNTPHEKEMSIKEYINKMKPDIKPDKCFIDNHNKEYEYYCIECKTHLCKECLKQREHINHDKIILNEIIPNEKEEEMIKHIIEQYNNKKYEDLKNLYELIYNAYKNYSNNYYFMMNINNILINYINNNKDYKISEFDFNNIKKIKDKIEQITDIKKKSIYELQKHIIEQNIILDKIKKANIDSQSILNKIIEQNEKEIKNLKENNNKYEKELYNIKNKKNKYENKIIELIKNIIDEINSINIILKLEKNNKLNNIKIENIDEISNIINEELKRIKNYINNNKIEKK